VPPLPIVPDDFAARLAASGAHAVFGPRTGSKTAELQIPPTLPPGALASILPLRVWRVESLRPNVTERVDGALLDGTPFAGHARHWRDLAELRDAQRTVVRARFADDHPAWLSHGTLHYWAALFDDATTAQLFASVAAEAGLAPTPLADGVRISRRGGLTYVFNYGDTVHTIDAVPPAAFVVGSADVEPRGVAVYRSPV
ncbi:beta-galactosidase trimerization domain-containing protein, partial [Burkholderia multivorans]